MRKLLALVALLGIYSELFSMENDVHIIDPHVVVFDVFLNNQKERLYHEIIYALAAVNKSCKKFLLDTAPERSEYLLRKTKQIGINLQELRYFNKYGSLLCDKGFRNKLLEMVFVSTGYFLDENEVKMFEGEWDNFKNDVISLPRPFLTSEGDLCCYGWGKSGDYMLWSKHQHLIQYCLAPDKKQQFFRCGIQLDRASNWALSHCAALPNLLKAFVDCPVRIKDLFARNMLFALEDAIIPDNYADYQALGNSLLDTKFDDLPETLKDAIVARYQECKKQRMTQLFAAIKEHKNEEAKQIIAEFPACVNTYHYEGDSRILLGEVTPLHVAVCKNNVACVELLLACKADCNAQATIFRYTPLYMALFHFHHPHLEVAQALTDAGADINERLSNNRTLLHRATMSSWVEKRVMFLLKNGADRTLRDDGGETALEFSQARDSDLAMITLACFNAVPERK